MTKVLSIANQKGGVGKTTISLQAIHYLLEIMKIEPSKILAIDFDGQGNFSSRLAEPCLDEIGNNSNDFKGGTASYELYHDVLDEVRPTVCPNGIHLIHAKRNDTDLFELGESSPISIIHNPKKNIQSILNSYEYVVVDCPPSLGRNLLSALMMSTHTAMPVKLSGFSVDGAFGLLDTAIKLKHEHNPDLEVLGIIINGMDNSVSHKKAFDTLKAGVNDFIFDNIIKYRTPLDTATSDGVPVWSLTYGHVAAGEVKAVLKELFDKVNRT